MEKEIGIVIIRSTHITYFVRIFLHTSYDHNEKWETLKIFMKLMKAFHIIINILKYKKSKAQT